MITHPQLVTGSGKGQNLCNKSVHNIKERKRIANRIVQATEFRRHIILSCVLYTRVLLSL